MIKLSDLKKIICRNYRLSIPSGTLPPITIHEHWWMLYHETAPQPEDEQQPRPHL